jgi:uncharacterized protein
VIVNAPADIEHSYRVAFPGGEEVSLTRREIQVLSHYQREVSSPFVDPMTQHDLKNCVIYRCVVGSKAYGLDHDASDVDRRGIYLPPASMHWSLYGVPEQLDLPDTEECYWELEKYLRLALKGNPNVLETLYTPIVEHADAIALQLRSERSIFLSKLIYQTFNGYAISQFEKFSRTLARGGVIKWKHAMHLIRLLRSGIEALRMGSIPVRVESGREELIAIRNGEVSWEMVESLRVKLHAEFEQAFIESRLPDRPDYQRANALLIDARREMARREMLP